MTIADLGLTAHQLRNARGIIAAVKLRKWPIKAAVIATEVALAEAGLRMLASANVPESQKYPHEKLSWTTDGLGHDHASMGMFQQQTGTRWTPAGYGYAMNQTTMNSQNGWGPPSVLMDPEKSTELFLNALARQDWQSQDPWVAGQNVQRSAYDGNPRQANNNSSVYGGNYKGQHNRAVRIVNALWSEGTDPLEEIMALYKDKAAFELALRKIVREEVQLKFEAFTRIDGEDTTKPSPGHFIKTVVSTELDQAIPKIVAALKKAK